MFKRNPIRPFSKTQAMTAMAGLRNFVGVLLRELDEGGLKYRAMSLVYTSLLSLAPLLAVSFSVLKGFGIHNQIEPALRKILEPLGEKSAEITANVIGFVENIQVGVLGFVGFVMLFYTVVSVLTQIEDCFNHIWRLTKQRPLLQRISEYLSIVLIGPVLLFSAVGITASMGNAAVVQKLVALEPFGLLYYLVGAFLPYLLTVSAFSFAYAFIPNTAVPWRAALTGGLFAGLTWKASGFLFTSLVANSAQYSAIYSGFAAILIAMIWLYLTWLILLCGGVIAFHVQFPHYLGYAARRPHLSIERQEQLALILMTFIGRQHVQGGEALSLRQLADKVGLPWELITERLDGLTRQGFLMKLADDTGYLLARDSDSILLRDILCAIRTAGDQAPLTFQDQRDDAIMQRLLSDHMNATARFLGDLSLRDVIQEAEAPE